MQTPTVPNKQLFHITEAVWILAPYLDRGFDTVKRQIYREIEAGKIDARIYLGRKMMTRDQILQIIEGQES